MKVNINDLIYEYNEQGYTIVDLYNKEDYEKLEYSTIDWIKSLFAPWVNIEEKRYNIELYHHWYKEIDNSHRSILCAANRFKYFNNTLYDILVNNNVKNILNKLSKNEWQITNNEGLGNFGFRLIRPNMNDGYPFSCKSWGPAKNVVSFWIPIIGFTKNETLKIIPKSHLKEYEKYLPEKSKFADNEYRLVNEVSENEYIQLELSKGEAILFHPKLIHSEDISGGDCTRINLEFRVKID